MGPRIFGSGWGKYRSIYLRTAPSAAFLASVTDRLGIWGPNGTVNVAWGDMAHFMAYAAKLTPWFANEVIPVVAWLVTIAETSLGAALILGFQTRRAAQLSGWLLLAFAVGMTVGSGIKFALNASVFSASAGAFFLATSPEYPLSIDSLRRIGKSDSARSACISSQAKIRV